MSELQEEILRWLGNDEMEIYHLSWKVAKKTSVDTKISYDSWGDDIRCIKKTCTRHSTYVEGLPVKGISPDEIYHDPESSKQEGYIPWKPIQPPDQGRRRSHRGNVGFLRQNFKIAFSRSLKRLEQRKLITRTGKMVALTEQGGITNMRSSGLSPMEIYKILQKKKDALKSKKP